MKSTSYYDQTGTTKKGYKLEHAVFTGAVGELTIDTTNDIAVVHDGVTQGGIPLVGTLAEQKILNKTAIGIGTASLDEGLYVTGVSTFRGDLFAVPDPTLVYAGIISYFPNQNTVTGINTAGVEVGNLLSVDQCNSRWYWYNFRCWINKLRLLLALDNQLLLLQIHSILVSSYKVVDGMDILMDPQELT